PPLRARTEAGPVRRIVPPATRASAPPRRGRAAAARAGSGGARLPRRRWPGRRGREAGYASRVTRYDDLIAALRDAAHPDRPVPADFEAYLDKVRTRAYAVTDGDVEALKTAGHPEDQILQPHAAGGC